MEDVVKSMTAELDKDLKGISAVKPTPLVHTTTARDRVTNAITERRMRASLTAAYLAREKFVDYAVYAKWRGKLVMS